MPRTLSVEEYKELGKRYYGRKDYERARDAFTDGIDASTGRDIQLYDYRAATFDKLGDSSSALADARFMIKNFERDPKGYLRAGHLLLSLSKKPQALQIYARGLKHVPSTNPSINLLRGAHDKLNRELCPPKAVDPFTQLPQEIVEMIMSYLPFYACVSCLRVSKGWKMFLSGLPSLWTNMNLYRPGGGRGKVKPASAFVETCVRMSRGQIREARIANMPSKGMLQLLVAKCKALEKLEFVLMTPGTQPILEAVISARTLKCLIVHQDIEVHGDTVMQMLKHRLTLEEVRIHRVGRGCTDKNALSSDLPNLRILDLRNVHHAFLETGHLRGLLQHATNITDLTFEDGTAYGTLPGIAELFSGLTNLEHLRLKSSNIGGFPQVNPSTLRTLHYESTWSVLYDDVPYLPRIEELRIRHPYELNLFSLLLGDGTLDVDGRPPSQLTSLSYSASHLARTVDNEPMISHPRLQNLTDLELLGFVAMDISDKDVGRLVELKQLRRLHLNSSPITGVGIKQLVTGLKGVLRHITLTACEDVGHDAVEWAARQGVEVVVLSHANGSKIVRR